MRRFRRFRPQTCHPPISLAVRRIAFLALAAAFACGLTAEYATAQSNNRDKWKLDCIVIDPGHGGKDPGAIGATGVKEKDIVLGIALKLGDILKQHKPDIKVVYTRSTDRFIELDKRGKIANEAGGKLFISIHCNSLEKKPSNFHGFEVYLLRPGRTEEAIRIAEFENSVIKLEDNYKERYKKLDAKQFILINMAQSAYAHHSEKFASLLHERAAASKEIKSLGIKQAGFYVLVGASMPAVLIETDYISNPKREKWLSTLEGQSHMAYMFYYAINDFIKYYDDALNE